MSTTTGTSRLQRYVGDKLSVHLGGYTIRENIRPDWLITPRGERLELDFLIEELDVAIEVQGKQHYIYIPFFHGNESGFKNRIRWDKFKRKACKQNGIRLFEVASHSDIDLLVYDLLPDEPEEEYEHTYVPLDRKARRLGWEKRILVKRLIRRANRQYATAIEQSNNESAKTGYLNTINKIQFHIDDGLCRGHLLNRQVDDLLGSLDHTPPKEWGK